MAKLLNLIYLLFNLVNSTEFSSNFFKNDIHQNKLNFKSIQFLILKIN